MCSREAARSRERRDQRRHHPILLLLTLLLPFLLLALLVLARDVMVLSGLVTHPDDTITAALALLSPLTYSD